MKNGFFKVAAAVPALRLADCDFNSQEIISLMQQAHRQGAELLVLPDLCLSGSSCGDLFYQRSLIDQAGTALAHILEADKDICTLTVISLPIAIGQQHYKVALAIQHGKILGLVPDTNPHYTQQRWFAQSFPYEEIELLGQDIPCSEHLLIQADEAQIAILFHHDDSLESQAEALALDGADILVHLSCQSDRQGAYIQRRERLLARAQSLKAACLYASSGLGESSADELYGGHALIVEMDEVLAENAAFSLESQLILSDVNLSRLETARKRHSAFRQALPDDDVLTVAAETCSHEAEGGWQLHRQIDPYPMLPKSDEGYQEIFDIQVAGLVRRMQQLGQPTLVLGISGGLDSTLSLLASVKACEKLQLDSHKVIGITMPGFGTSGQTHSNALKLMELLGIEQREISIRSACEQHFSDIGHDTSLHNVVYENAQARERTQILMDVANQVNGIVIGTGDLSELALGWATYNGDHMSMYGTNASLSKTLIRHLVAWIARTQVSPEAGKVLMDIVDTPVSPELLPTDNTGNIAQKTEDLVGPYELHDFFLYHLLESACPLPQIFEMAKAAFAGIHDEASIKQSLKTFVRRFFTQQFKRSCMPEGAQAGLLSLSPRGAWLMPSDAQARAWMQQVEEI